MASRIVISPAGSGKTDLIITDALSAPSNERILITTYTTENTEQLIRRIFERVGCVPKNIVVMTWFQFLLRDGIKPYQSYVTDVGHIQSVNFITAKPPFSARADIRKYYFDDRGNAYSDSVSDLVCVINERSSGSVVDRLETMYDRIYIDEMQDLVGYDLEFLEQLLKSQIELTIVGDPRQYTYMTNRSNKNSGFRGPKIIEWVKKQTKGANCLMTEETSSRRCNAAICAFASELYPEFAAMVSKNVEVSGHDGIFLVAPRDVHSYVEMYEPRVLRYSVSTNTAGLQGLNIGLSKGSTFDRVLIFPTTKMVKYLKTADIDEAGDLAKLYVAATRAKYSVGFVTELKDSESSLASGWQSPTLSIVQGEDDAADATAR